MKSLFRFLTLALTSLVVLSSLLAADKNTALELMLPAVRFARSDDDLMAIYVLLSENGHFMTLGRKTLSAADWPADFDGDSRSTWIEDDKVAVITSTASAARKHLQFGPERIKWRRQVWVRVRRIEPSRGDR